MFLQIEIETCPRSENNEAAIKKTERKNCVLFCGGKKSVHVLCFFHLFSLIQLRYLPKPFEVQSSVLFSVINEVLREIKCLKVFSTSDLVKI